MPTLEQNRRRWGAFAWKGAGDEWSQGWDGTDRLWHATIWPRIGAFLPAPRVLEIACGHGRVSQYLVGLAEELVLVDLVEECVESCRRRFADHAHVQCVHNDGMSLPSCDVDVALSWDSLVHAERDVIASYLKELARVLRPGGVAFLHHSNLGASRDADTGALRAKNPHWRAQSVSAEIVRADAASAGLNCLAQEIVAWGGRALNDCFTLVRRPGADAPTPAPTDPESAPEPIVVVNHLFGSESKYASTLARLYGASPRLPEPPLVPTTQAIGDGDTRSAVWGDPEPARGAPKGGGGRQP